MSKLLLIDDDVRLAELLQRFFQRYNIELLHADRPSNGLNILSHSDINLVILDIMLPEMDGFETCKHIRKHSEVPIIMLTARGDVMDRIIGLELGADDYLAKPFEPRELLARIQSVLKRYQAVTAPQHQLSFGPLRIDLDLRQVTLNTHILALSSGEYHLLTLLAQNPGKTFSRDEILNQLRGSETELFSRAVDILISRLRRKLEPLDLIKTIRGQGYCFAGRQHM